MFRRVFQCVLVITVVLQHACGNIIEGVDVEKLSDEQLTGFVDAIDEQFVGTLGKLNMIIW